MKIIILASGKGTRLQRTHALPKPFVEILGKRLFEWALDSLRYLLARGLLSKQDITLSVRPQDIRSPERISRIEGAGIHLLETSDSSLGPVHTAIISVNRMLDSGQLELEESVVFSDVDHFLDSADLYRGLVRLSNARVPTVLVATASPNIADQSWSFLAKDESAPAGYLAIEKPRKISEFSGARPIAGIYGFSSAAEFLSIADKVKHQLDGDEIYMSHLINLAIRSHYKLETSKLEHFVPLGNPEQIEAALVNGLLEFEIAERPTIFIDLDGTLIKHDKGVFSPSGLYSPDIHLLDTTFTSAINKLFEGGTKIVLTSSRPESERQKLISALAIWGVSYDSMLLGITGGPRVIVNDNKPASVHTNTAVGIEVERDSGDLLQVLEAIETQTRPREVQLFNTESGATTVKLRHGQSGTALVRKVSEHSENSRELIAYQAHWYSFVGQLRPQIVPGVIQTRLSQGTGRSSFDMEFLENLEPAASFFSRVPWDSAALMAETLIEDLMFLYDSTFRGEKGPLTDFGFLLKNKVLPGLHFGYSQLGVDRNAQAVPFSFEDGHTNNRILFLEKLLDGDSSIGRDWANTSLPVALIHGDLTLGNVSVQENRKLYLLDPIGSRADPLFRYDGRYLGSTHPAWDLARLDLSVQFGYDLWADNVMCTGTIENGFEVSLEVPEIRGFDWLSDHSVWAEWVPLPEHLRSFLVAVTIARIFPYKVKAGKVGEAGLCLRYIDEILSQLED